MLLFKFSYLLAGDCRRDLCNVLLWLPVNLVQIFSFLLVCCILIPTALIVRVVTGSSRAAIWMAHQWWGPIVVGGSLARLFVSGLKFIQPGKTYLVVANHQSFFDIPVLYASLPSPIHFVSAEKIRAFPGVGRFGCAVGTIFLQKNSRSSMARGVRELAFYLREGRTTVLFPEGTRTRDGTMGPFYPALFTAAIEAGVEILPVAIVGSGTVMPRGSGFLFRPAKVEVRIGSPISTQGLKRSDRDSVARQAWKAVDWLRIRRKSKSALHA